MPASKTPLPRESLCFAVTLNTMRTLAHPASADSPGRSFPLFLSLFNINKPPCAFTTTVSHIPGTYARRARAPAPAAASCERCAGFAGPSQMRSRSYAHDAVAARTRQLPFWTGVPYRQAASSRSFGESPLDIYAHDSFNSRCNPCSPFPACLVHDHRSPYYIPSDDSSICSLPLLRRRNFRSKFYVFNSPDRTVVP